MSHAQQKGQKFIQDSELQPKQVNLNLIILKNSFHNITAEN